MPSPQWQEQFLNGTILIYQTHLTLILKLPTWHYPFCKNNYDHQDSQTDIEALGTKTILIIDLIIDRKKLIQLSHNPRVEAIEMLQHVHSVYDQLIEKYGLQKVDMKLMLMIIKSIDLQLL